MSDKKATETFPVMFRLRIAKYIVCGSGTDALSHKIAAMFVYRKSDVSTVAQKAQTQTKKKTQINKRKRTLKKGKRI